jgi:hypothetical protein
MKPRYLVDFIESALFLNRGSVIRYVMPLKLKTQIMHR